MQMTGARRGPKPNPHTRANLLRAGMRMLHEGGYAATGVKEIVDAAQVPKGSFYNHFDSKEAFGAEVADFYFDSSLDELRAELVDADLPPLERLRGYFEARIRRFRESGYLRGCLLGNLSLEVADHSELIRGRLSANFATWSALFEECIAQGQADGTIASTLPAPDLARFVLNAWEGAMLRMRAEHSDAPLEDFLLVVFEHVLV